MIEKLDNLKKSNHINIYNYTKLNFSSYFDNEFNNIINLEDVENYRRKLYNFKDYLGSTDGYTFFNDYYVNKMVDLEENIMLLENGTKPSLYLIKKQESKFLLFYEIYKKIIYLVITNEDTKE